MIDAGIIEGLLALVAPRCSLCHRAAVSALREDGPDQMAPGVYRCQVHPCSVGKWSDLPGAKTIRAALSILESASGDNA
jgi:hypothetical protein